MKIIDVGNDFYHFLANRNENQGNGKHTAIEFRNNYLSFLDNKQAWEEKNNIIVLDFKNVDTMISSFANEAFAYFTRYAKPEEIKKHIQFQNISNVKMEIIDTELKNGYKQQRW